MAARRRSSSRSRRQPRASALSSSSHEPKAMASTSRRVASTSAPISCASPRRARPAAAGWPGPFLPAVAVEAPTGAWRSRCLRAAAAPAVPRRACAPRRVAATRSIPVRQWSRARALRSHTAFRRPGSSRGACRTRARGVRAIRQGPCRRLLGGPQPVQALEPLPRGGRIGAVQRRILERRGFLGHPALAAPGGQRRLQFGLQCQQVSHVVGRVGQLGRRERAP